MMNSGFGPYNPRTDGLDARITLVDVSPQSPISDQAARNLDRVGMPVLPPLSEGWDPDEVSWEFIAAGYNDLVPCGWRDWRSWEEIPVDVWCEQASDSGWRVLIFGCDLFLVIAVGDECCGYEVNLYPPQPQELVNAWHHMPSEPEVYYRDVLQHFRPFVTESPGMIGDELVASFVPWEEGQYRYPDGFQFWSLAAGGWLIIDSYRKIGHYLDNFDEGVAAFRKLATQFGAVPVRESKAWPTE
jgi:hypothetical protein